MNMNMGISSRLRFADMREGLLFQDGNVVYQTSSVDSNHITAQQVYPNPPRTTVVTFVREELEYRCKPISASMYRKVQAMWNEWAAARR